MSGSSNLLLFDPSLTNIESDTDYAADTQRTGGVVTGQASGPLYNKQAAQASIVPYAMGNLLSTKGYTVSDSDPASFIIQLSNEFQNVVGINAQVGTSYAIVASDRNKIVTFSNASPVAVTIPQAGTTGALPNFANLFKTTLINLGAGAVTLTPTTSTVDGQTSITLQQNQGVTLYSDETNYFTYRGWFTVPAFTSYALSSNITITSAAAWSFTHGLGKAAKAFELYLKCLTAELNWSVGDMVRVSSDNAHGTNDQGAGAAILNGNTTTINGRFGSATSCFTINDHTTGQMTNITNSKWALVVAAWA